MTTVERDPGRLFARPAVERQRRADGSILLRSRQQLSECDRCVGDWLVTWADRTPEQPFLLERSTDGGWHGVTYAQALARVRRIGGWLLRQGASTDHPVAILSDNGVAHGLLALAAMHVGVPVVPVSSAYSLVSRDFRKLKAILALVRPRVVLVGDAERFAPALAAVRDLHGGVILATAERTTAADVLPFDAALQTDADRGVDEAFAAIGPETVAKVLFTSGSTGTPKGVINTQRMLCTNQQQIRQVWPFIDKDPPIVLDWLPWSHTFGSNHNFNLVLHNGGTLYVDDGRPAPGLFDRTTANLRDISPTLYFNVPRGYDMLVAALRSDERLRSSFFRRLQLIFYAAAALPQHLWDALESLARETTGERIALVSAWGSTETAPLATSCHFQAERAGNIGLPVPGCELKLVPNGAKLEVRVRGPNVTGGYWRQPELSAQSFDEEGFYAIGDAVRFVDDAEPERGLYFDGRVAEDFKLTTGTWVNVGDLRVRAIAALAPVAQDIVVTGHDRDEVGFLIFPNLPACRALCADLAADAAVEAVLNQAAVLQQVRTGLERLRGENTGSSTFAARALLLVEPPSIDAGEITDKGYINQRAVVARRADLVTALHDSKIAEGVILLDD